MATLKDLLPQIPKDELAILRDLNSKLDESKLTEATAKEAAQAVKTIVQNWKTWSKITVAAMLLIPNISNALETYSPETLNAIRTEMSAETPTKVATPDSIPGAIKSFNFGENFDSGETTLTNKENLVKNVSDIKNWIKGKKLNNFKIVITASESQVTNPKGFEKPKSLAQARAKVVEDLVSNLGFNKIEINTKQGTTRYKSGVDNPDDPKYKAEQFVTVSIVVENNICSMPSSDEDGKQGNASNSYITYDNYISGKGKLVLHTGTIPDRLIIVDANGNIKQDTGYITTQKKPGDWKYTPMYVLELTQKRISNPNIFTGNKIKTITVTDYEDLKSQLSNKANANTAGDEIGPALVQMKKMIEKGIKEFVIYDLATQDVTLDFDEDRGEVQALVCSPVGKTGFNIKGSCTR
jgi:hypothetical protein